MNWLRRLFAPRPPVCAHVYSEVPDNEQNDPQASMTNAIVNLYNYDVRCEKCGRRGLMNSESYGAHLRATGRMK